MPFPIPRGYNRDVGWNYGEAGFPLYALYVVAPGAELSLELRQALQEEGVKWVVAEEGQEPSYLSPDSGPHALLLDATAAGADQLAATAVLCRQWRLPLLVLLSAQSLQGNDLSYWGDDFILFPFQRGELTARIRRLLARQESRLGEGAIRVGALAIDPHSYRVYVAGREVEFTFMEYKLLKLLASNPGRVFTREELLSQVWGYDYYGGNRTVDVHIRRLRSKIEDAAHTFIETVWNVGYRFLG